MPTINQLVRKGREAIRVSAVHRHKVELSGHARMLSWAKGPTLPETFRPGNRHSLPIGKVGEDRRQVLRVGKKPDNVDVVIGHEVEPTARENPDAADP